MDNILKVEFTFRSKTYSALIRTKVNSSGKQHYITIMNGELEQLLFGHHVIIENEGVLTSPQDIINADLLELKQSITTSLSRLLQDEYAKLN